MIGESRQPTAHSPQFQRRTGARGSVKLLLIPILIVPMLAWKAYERREADHAAVTRRAAEEIARRQSMQDEKRSRWQSRCIARLQTAQSHDSFRMKWPIKTSTGGEFAFSTSERGCGAASVVVWISSRNRSKLFSPIGSEITNSDWRCRSYPFDGLCGSGFGTDCQRREAEESATISIHRGPGTQEERDLAAVGRWQQAADDCLEMAK